MNTKGILMSILMIGVVAMAAGAGTIAYFSDVETSTGNTFTAGTVDIKVDGDNPWEKSYTVKDIEPSYTGYITFPVRNVGTSPVVVWKQLVVTKQEGGAHPESEVDDDPNDKINNIKSWTFYDLLVNNIEIIPATNEVRVDNIENCWIKLGDLQANEVMTVKQSYHLRPDTTNWAQGDKMTFTITLMAVQTNAPNLVPTSGTMTLENKDKYWRPLTGDGKSATVVYNYDTDNKILSGTFTATGLTDGEYKLIYYADPWPGTGGLVLATATTSGGEISSTAFSGTPVPSSTDKNLPVGVKVWLVPSSDYDAGRMTAWNPSKYLFEMNLINLPQ